MIPPPLRPGDSVIVLAPSSAPRDADRYARGLDVLRQVYDVHIRYRPEEVSSPHGYLSAPDKRRLDDLRYALADPDARAVIAARGGYGCMRLLKQLHVIAESASPKWVIGYSDLTALQLALYRHLGWCSLSAPVVTEWATLSPAAPPADGWGADAVQDGPAETDTLDAAACFQRIATQDEASPLPLAENLPVLTGGSNGRGPLLGGNLSVLTRLIGTPHLPDLTGAVLVLEDVGEAPYRIDRMLTHLDLAGHLDRLAGVVLGSFRPGDVSQPSLSMPEIFADHFSERSYPVATGLAYGHLLPRLTLPIGAPAELTVENGTARLRVDLHRSRTADEPPVGRGTA